MTQIGLKHLLNTSNIVKVSNLVVNFYNGTGMSDYGNKYKKYLKMEKKYGIRGTNVTDFFCMSHFSVELFSVPR